MENTTSIESKYKFTDDINRALDIFRGKDLRKIDLLCEDCKNLKNEDAKSFNAAAIKYIDDKNVAFRNILIEILQTTIKYSPELIEENYSYSYNDFRRNLVDITIFTKDEIIKQFLMKVIHIDKSSTVRSSIYESMINYNDDIDVLNLLIERYSKEVELDLLIIQLLSNFDFPKCEEFLFTILNKSTDRHKILMVLYSLEKIAHKSETVEFLIKNINKYESILHPFILKAIVKIVDNNSIDLYSISSGKINNLQELSSSLLAEYDEENYYIYLRINEDRIHLLKIDFLVQIFTSLSARSIKIVILSLVNNLHLKILENLFKMYFEKTKNVFNVIGLQEILLEQFDKFEVLLKNLKYIIEQELDNTEYSNNATIRELLSLF